MRPLAIVAFVHVALIWSLPVIVGHDLPQHLAYIRIIADRSSAHTAALYTVDRAELYTTTHWIAALIAQHTSVDFSVRLLYSVYAVAMLAAFAKLTRAVHGRSNLMILLGSLLVWNPIVCMGFLPFMMAMPIFVLGVAYAVDRKGNTFGLCACALGLGALHSMALGFFLVFLAVWSWRQLAMAIAVNAPLLALRPGSTSRVDLHTLWNLGPERALGLAWSSWGERGNVALATIAGPFPAGIRGVVLACFVVGAIVIALRAKRTAWTARRLRVGLAVLCFVGLALVLPTSMRTPDDCCLIDFRMYVLAFALLLALIPPRWFEDRIAELALVACLVVSQGVWTRQLHRASHEAEDAVALLGGLNDDDRLLALCFHDGSEHFDPTNGMLHYLGVHNSVRTAGVTSLFWAKYAPHLPVGYRDAPPPHPLDWRPWTFTTSEVESYTHVLVTLPDATDLAEDREGLRRFRRLSLPVMECRGRFCLYRVRSNGTDDFHGRHDGGR